MARGKKNVDPNNIKSKGVIFLLYPENEHHMKVFDILKKNHYEHLYVLHNRGLEYDDDARKEHFHVIVRFPSARWHSAIAEDLGIEQYLIQRLIDFKWYALYCTHYEFPEKEFYHPNEFDGSLRSIKQLKEYYEKQLPKQDRIKILREYINNADVLYLDDLIDYASKTGKVDLILSNSHLFSRLIDDHNFKIREATRILSNIPRDWIGNKTKEGSN